MLTCHFYWPESGPLSVPKFQHTIHSKQTQALCEFFKAFFKFEINSTTICKEIFQYANNVKERRKTSQILCEGMEGRQRFYFNCVLK